MKETKKRNTRQSCHLSNWVTHLGCLCHVGQAAVLLRLMTSVIFSVNGGINYVMFLLTCKLS